MKMKQMQLAYALFEDTVPNCDCSNTTLWMHHIDAK